MRAFYIAAVPAVNITYPLNTSYSTSVTFLNYTTSTLGGELSTCWYSTNNGGTNTTITCGNNATGLTSTEGNNTWTVWANDTGNNVNISRVTFVASANTAPNTPVVIINSTDGTNTTLQNLTCYATIADNNTGNLLNVSVEWYNGTERHLHIDYNNSYANGTLFNATLNYGNTSKWQNWSCGLRLFDGTDYSDWANSSKLKILNSLPNITLLTPPNGNDTTNRMPNFTWSAADGDSDSLTYEINITCFGVCGAVDDTRYATGIPTANYTPATPLIYFHDDQNDYKWQVRANDSENVGEWSTLWQINISTYIELSLPRDKIEFGTIALGESNDTSDDSPLPLLLLSNGNILTNVTINATDLWLTQTNPNQYYQFKVDYNSSELDSFNWSQSKTTYTNMPNTSLTLLAIAYLNYIDTNDSAEIDINISVPSSEGAGYRNSLVIFAGARAE